MSAAGILARRPVVGARPTLRVALNARFLAAGHMTGTHRSALQFTRGLIARCGHDFDLVVYAPCDRSAVGARVGGNPRCRIVEVPARGRAGIHAWEQMVWPRLEPGSLHLNLMNTASAMPGNARQVTIVHDVNAIRNNSPHALPFRLLARMNVAGGARKSARVVCFSNHVAGEVEKLLGVRRERISVIRQGAGFEPAGNGTGRGRGLYFLAVGSLQPHKNLSAVLRAFQALRREIPDLGLLVAGSAQKGYRDHGVSLDQPGVEATGYISDGELEQLYRGALALVYPSLEEGFGLPVVEAFQCGCPVITSNCSSLPEVAGDAAILIDPREAKEIEDAMRRVALSADLRADLRRRGLRRAKNYDWDEAVGDLMRVLREFSG